jgi:hypothetical protein
VVALGHAPFESLEAGFGLDQIRPSGEDVLLKCQPGVSRGALVVQRHADPLLEGKAAGVVARFAGENSEQGRLSGTVPSGKRHAIATHQLE